MNFWLNAGSSSVDSNKCLYSIGPRLKAFSDWLLKTMVLGTLETIFPAATREYAPLVEELWNDAAIQATYKRRSELEMLPNVAHYFLERVRSYGIFLVKFCLIIFYVPLIFVYWFTYILQVVDILTTDYEPSDSDILYAEGLISSNGLASVDFSFPQSAPDDDIDTTADQHNSLFR